MTDSFAPPSLRAVGSSAFFGNPGCFAALEAQLPELFRDKGPDDTVRVGVPACATGEEAYSIAILLVEYARGLEAPPLLQVLAADRSADVVRIARRGWYPPTLRADVSDERLLRFFRQQQHGFQVHDALREVVTFATHDMLDDPPFVGLDLVSCCNLPVDLDRKVQARLLEMFRRSLRAEGRLFLGASETLQGTDTGFTAIDEDHGLYAKRSSRHPPIDAEAEIDGFEYANSDLQSPMNATAVATIFLDRDSRIVRYTPPAAARFACAPGNTARRLTDLAPDLPYAELPSDAARVLSRSTPLEREIGMADGTWVLARLQPDRTIENGVAGVVLSLIDITERKRAEEVSRWLSSVVASSRDAIISFSLTGIIRSWSGGATRVFGHAPQEMIGQPMSVLVDPAHADAHRRMLERIGRMLDTENWETLARAKDGTILRLTVTASPIADAEGRVIGGTASVRDTSAARGDQEALRRSEEHLRLVIENARDYAIFSTDVDRVITSWNSGAEHLLGYTESEAVGRSGDMIFTPEDRAAGAPIMEARTAMAETRAADERVHMRKDGSRFWANGTLMRMDDTHGGPIGFVKILRDETQARNARAELQRSQDELLKALDANEQARAELEKADLAKDRFLAVLSHELRNPLAAVMTASELLADPATAPEEQARAAALIQRQARTMKSLLDDLLDVSRLAVGRFELRIREASLAEVVDPALEAVEAAMRGAGHLLKVELPTPPVRLRVDPLRITQVLVNLLGNAAKYTPPGGEIVLQVHLDRDEVCMAVSDNGVGIAPERIGQIFDLYTQGPPAAHALNDGLGVGLSLVRTIVSLHGGTVEGTSDGPQRGSRFVVRLPHATAAARPAPPAASVPVGPSREILVADDNADAAWALTQLLRRAGHRTRLARSGAEALSSALASAPDVAVLDIGMPDIDGFDVARRLRASPDTASMVLVALTGWSGEADRARALAAGFDILLSKPTDLEALLAAVETAAAGRRG